jgi:hypothetical protein
MAKPRPFPWLPLESSARSFALKSHRGEYAKIDEAGNMFLPSHLVDALLGEGRERNIEPEDAAPYKFHMARDYTGTNRGSVWIGYKKEEGALYIKAPTFEELKARIAQCEEMGVEGDALYSLTIHNEAVYTGGKRPAGRVRVKRVLNSKGVGRGREFSKHFPGNKTGTPLASEAFPEQRMVVVYLDKIVKVVDEVLEEKKAKAENAKSEAA